MKGRIALVKTYYRLNTICLLVGLALVWHFTHSVPGVVSGFIASLHFSETYHCED